MKRALILLALIGFIALPGLGDNSSNESILYDIIKLSEADVSEKIILKKIQQDVSSITLSADDIILLKRGGVSGTIIEFMMDLAPKKVPSVPETVVKPIPPPHPAPQSAHSNEPARISFYMPPQRYIPGEESEARSNGYSFCLYRFDGDSDLSLEVIAELPQEESPASYDLAPGKYLVLTYYREAFSQSHSVWKGRTPAVEFDVKSGDRFEARLKGLFGKRITLSNARDSYDFKLKPDKHLVFGGTSLRSFMRQAHPYVEGDCPKINF